MDPLILQLVRIRADYAKTRLAIPLVNRCLYPECCMILDTNKDILLAEEVFSLWSLGPEEPAAVMERSECKKAFL